MLYEKHPRRQITSSDKKMRRNHTQQIHGFGGAGWSKTWFVFDQLCLVSWPNYMFESSDALMSLWSLVHRNNKSAFVQDRTDSSNKAHKEDMISQLISIHSHWQRSKASWFQAVFWWLDVVDDIQIILMSSLFTGAFSYIIHNHHDDRNDWWYQRKLLISISVDEHVSWCSRTKIELELI